MKKGISAGMSYADRASGPHAESVVFDLDGTLADVGHRLHHLTGDRKDWNAFHAGMADDGLNGPVATLFRGLKTLGYRMVIATGRFEASRSQTEVWLRDRVLFHHDLFMRPDGDFRADHLVKEDMLRGLQIDRDSVLLVVDDRRRVVEMWRRNGLTVLQCAEGNF